jgi:hypothetical protein
MFDWIGLDWIGGKKAKKEENKSKLISNALFLI